MGILGQGGGVQGYFIGPLKCADASMEFVCGEVGEDDSFLSVLVPGFLCVHKRRNYYVF